MKIEKYICDACKKETDKVNDIEIPILSIGNETKQLRLNKVDLCTECYEKMLYKISDTYYEICKDNNNTGIILVEA